MKRKILTFIAEIVFLVIIGGLIGFFLHFTFDIYAAPVLSLLTLLTFYLLYKHESKKQRRQIKP